MKKTMLALAILLQGASALSAAGPVKSMHKDSKIMLLKENESLKASLDACRAGVKNYQKMHDDCLRLVEHVKAQARAEISRLRAQLAGGEGGGH